MPAPGKAAGIFLIPIDQKRIKFFFNRKRLYLETVPGVHHFHRIILYEILQPKMQRLTLIRLQQLAGFPDSGQYHAHRDLWFGPVDSGPGI